MRVDQVINSIPTWIWSLLLFAIALGVRLLHLTDTDIAGDEPFSIFVAQFEPAFIIEYLSTGNNPPLFELLLHYWMNWVGESDYQLRLLPTLFSALTVIPIYLTGTRFFNKQVGLLAALLFVFSVFHIRFAHEVRVYSLQSLLTATSIHVFFSIVLKPSVGKRWLYLGLVWVLMLYSHYVSVYMIGTQILLGVFLIPKEHLKKAIGVLVVLAVSYLPNIFVFINRLDVVVESGGTWVQPPGWGEIYGSVNLMLNDRLVTVVLVLVLVAGFLLTKSPRMVRIAEVSQPRYARTIVLLFLIPYLSQFFVSKTFLPMFTDRYILYTSVPLYLSIAWIVYHLWSNAKLSLVGPLALLASVIALGTLKPTNNRDVAGAVKQVKEWQSESSITYVLPEEFDLTFAYHYNREWFGRKGEVNSPKSELQSAMHTNQVYAISSAEQIVAGQSNRVVCIDAHSEFLHPGNGILESLAQQYTLKDSAHFHQIFDVYLFERE